MSVRAFYFDEISQIEILENLQYSTSSWGGVITYAVVEDLTESPSSFCSLGGTSAAKFNIALEYSEVIEGDETYSKYFWQITWKDTQTFDFDDGEFQNLDVSVFGDVDPGVTTPITFVIKVLKNRLELQFEEIDVTMDDFTYFTDEKITVGGDTVGGRIEKYVLNTIVTYPVSDYVLLLTSTKPGDIGVDGDDIVLKNGTVIWDTEFPLGYDITAKFI